MFGTPKGNDVRVYHSVCPFGATYSVGKVKILHTPTELLGKFLGGNGIGIGDPFHNGEKKGAGEEA